ncbi:uncharacterized protein LOC131017735 isoform X2 [Salvia miltiorrhiza]|uniref:uncharacterized protein LOC131017735 isoform X2 n=1 Tax=Salvia miltiorrhiza TaxID=226208 RepID=UPI0025ABEA19|nr:uncharacterized protein LOC131017735 isoform X2 [Salvia miltiorrhiza]
MEFGHSGDVMKKRSSFGLSVADEKIKLIDILSEDDYFLVACDHSLQSSVSGIERMEQKEQNLCVQESRTSFLRRSLAWNSAFFNSSGVLDPDELFFMNNGASATSLLPAAHEVRNRRSESESTKNNVSIFGDWFELQPSITESKSSKALNVVERSSKSRPKQIAQSSRICDRSCNSKIKSDRTSIGRSINVESEGKMKKESFSRRASGIRNWPAISNHNMENKSTRTSLGQGLVMGEKSAYKISSNLQPITSLSAAKFSPIFTPTSAAASALSKSKSELKKTQPSASSSTSKISRLSFRKKGIGNISASTHSTSSFASPANPTRHFPSATLFSPVHKQRRSVDSKDVKEASNLQSSLQIPKSMRPSGLRPPSPRHRFFDESTPQHAERSRKMPQRNRKNPSSESSKRDITAAAIDEKNGKKEVNFPVHQLDNLCRNFEAVALESEKISRVKEENKQPSSRMASSRPCRRTPLADKTPKCNFSRAFASPLMEPKKDQKLARRASSVRYA